MQIVWDCGKYLKEKRGFSETGNLVGTECDFYIFNDERGYHWSADIIESEYIIRCMHQNCR